MWEHHTVAAELLSVWLLCKSPVTAHPKGNIWDWDLVTVEAVWVEWHDMLSCWKQPSENWNAVVTKGWTWSVVILKKKKKAQLVLRSPKCTKTRKYPPLHCTTTIYFCVPLVGSHSWFLPVYLNVIQQWPALLPFCFSMPQFFSLLL